MYIKWGQIIKFKIIYKYSDKKIEITKAYFGQHPTELQLCVVNAIATQLNFCWITVLVIK